MLFFVLLSVFYGIKTDKRLEIIYTNDIMGTLEPTKAYWVSLELPPDIGNAQSLEYLVSEERKEGNVIAVNSGNLASYNIPGQTKEPAELASFLNSIGYDASLIGTNELSYGKEFLEKLINFSEVPLISGNLEGGHKGFVIRERGQVRIGIFGITSPYYPLFTPKRFREDFRIDVNIDEIAEKLVGELKKREVDIIIGISDAGFRRDSIIADNIDGIDCIIGSSGRGWTLREPFETPVNHTLLCKTYSNLSSAGKLVFYLDGKNDICGYEHEAVSLFLEEYPPYK